jgi:hypothetical protein
MEVEILAADIKYCNLYLIPVVFIFSKERLGVCKRKTINLRIYLYCFCFSNGKLLNSLGKATSYFFKDLKPW